MRTRLISRLTTLVFSGLVPMMVFAQEPPAQGCGNYEDQMSDEQAQYLADENLPIEVPEGQVETIQRCDMDGDNTVDINDIRAISRLRNTPAAHPDDPADWDRNNFITIGDARGCQRACTLPRCAVPTGEPPPDMDGGETAPADCTQSKDLDGDGTEDFVGLFESTSQEVDRGDWTLEVVILNEDEDENVQHITFPFTGQAAADETEELSQHLSVQPCDNAPCEIDLHPGIVTIDKPAVVSYRDGEPHVIYYFEDGVVHRAYYGIDD